MRHFATAPPRPLRFPHNHPAAAHLVEPRCTRSLRTRASTPAARAEGARAAVTPPGGRRTPRAEGAGAAVTPPG
eukprot:6559039-Prymnesium_polylepis.1